MSDDALISARGVAKKYATRTRRAMAHGRKDVVGALRGRGRDPRLRASEFWALDGVDLDVGPGDSVGVIGVNGAGKSTLLRVLYGLTKPDRGTVEVRGRIGGLLDLGSGFQPTLTGRENVEAELTLHAEATGAEVDLDDIAAFADIGPFLDAPVRTYSQGMRMRLGFSVVAHLEPDVLLIDEVLAVGDYAFRKKCGHHIRSYLERGGALVLVSHSVWIVQSLCHRAIVLDRGRVTFDGPADEAVRHYLQVESLPETGAMVDEDLGEQPGLPITVDDVAISAVDAGSITPGGPVEISVAYRADQTWDGVIWAVMVWSPDETVALATEFTERLGPVQVPKGPGQIRCTIDSFPLLAGEYLLRVGAIDATTRVALGIHGFEGRATRFSVEGPPPEEPFRRLTAPPVTGLDVDWDPPPG